VNVRPRTTGEILDDALRLYLADAPILLALSSLFTAPAALGFLLLLTSPRPEGGWQQFTLPAVVAALLPLTGLSSGACQAALYMRAAGEEVRLGPCLRSGLRRGLDHVAARAVVLTVGLVAMLCLLMPGLAVWAGASGVHAILAGGDERFFPALGKAGREAGQQSTKAMAVILSRPVVLTLAVVNLHSLVRLGLWTAEELGGFDLAFATATLGLGNPAYVAVLALFAWLLTAPFAEAANFLLHADARSRFQAMDLSYRVQRLFGVPVARGSKLVLLVAAALLIGTPLRAMDQRQVDLREARQEIQVLREEVATAEPYPGAGRWLDRLRAVRDRLDQQRGQPRGSRVSCRVKPLALTTNPPNRRTEHAVIKNRRRSGRQGKTNRVLRKWDAVRRMGPASCPPKRQPVSRRSVGSSSAVWHSQLWR
jgi:hypothetical protein